MVNINYREIVRDLLNQLPAKQREVIERRFGLKGGERETLESIGKSYGICRERVRQIEKVGLVKMKKKASGYKEASKLFAKYLKNIGGVREESIMLEELGGADYKSHAYFLLTLSGDFIRASESEDFNSLWALNKESLEAAKNFIKASQALLEEKKTLMSSRELARGFGDQEVHRRILFGNFAPHSKEQRKTSTACANGPKSIPKASKTKFICCLRRPANRFTLPMWRAKSREAWCRPCTTSLSATNGSC